MRHCLGGLSLSLQPSARRVTDQSGQMLGQQGSDATPEQWTGAGRWSSEQVTSLILALS